MNKKTFYITTPIYYPNAAPHLGHAYSTLIADTAARYHALKGEDTYFLTGTDENTQKVIQAAEKAGENPRSYLEQIVGRFKELYTLLNISYSQFIRTSDEIAHWPGVIEMWKRIDTNGDLYKGEYQGLYCVGCEAFLTERDLVEGKCPNHGTAPQTLSEENYFFKLSAYTEKIKSLIEDGEIQVVPTFRKKDVLAFMEGGLEDISFSRPTKAVEWGVPVPGDPEQKMYVWMDALTNYITALGFGRDERNMHFWPGIHIVGKDILRFHAIIWPAMLLSAGLPLPKSIVVHGMIISGGQKMSKSLGNVISPYEMIERYGSEATRYLLVRHVHPFEDTDMTWERMDEWYNAHLANGLGNLAARIMKMAEDHLDAPTAHPENLTLPAAYCAALDAFEWSRAADMIWQRIGALDERIQNEQPFKLVKEDAERGTRVIAELTDELYQIAHMLEPMMPGTSVLIKEAVATNTKPDTLFTRI